MAEKAAGVASFLLVASILGRIVMGWLADRIPKKYVMLIAFSAVAGAVPLLYAGDVGRLAYVFAFVFGFGMGADYMMIPLMTAECFGVRSLGKLMGIIITTDSLGQAFTPVIVGRLFDIHRNYNLGFALGKQGKWNEAVPRFDIYWMGDRWLGANVGGKRRRRPCWDPDGHRIAFVKRLSREKTMDYPEFRALRAFVYQYHAPQILAQYQNHHPQPLFELQQKYHRAYCQRKPFQYRYLKHVAHDQQVFV
jgi:hypothetical protein